MSKLSSYITLLRPQQYYKNLLIFLGIIFSANLFELNLYLPLVIGFLALAFVSSISYIINDWNDIEADRNHPEKKFRPLASGDVSIPEAVVLIILLMVVVVLLVVLLTIDTKSIDLQTNIFLFVLILLAIFFTSQFYSLFFKNKAFYDVIFISLNYIWRALAGVIIIAVTLSPWLFFLGFLFAMFLALSKRKGDLFLLKENAPKHKKVFEIYTNQILDYYILIVAGTLLVSYSIYVVESVIDFNRHYNDFTKFQNPAIMLLTLPIVTIILMRLIYLETSGNEKIRKAELLFFDKEILLNGALIGILTFISLYWSDFKLDQFIKALGY